MVKLHTLWNSTFTFREIRPISQDVIFFVVLMFLMRHYSIIHHLLFVLFCFVLFCFFPVFVCLFFSSTLNLLACSSPKN